MNGARSRSVMIVEDEFMIAEVLSMYVEDLGMEVCGIADTARKAVALAGSARPDLILMDVRLVGAEDGVWAALEIRPLLPSPIIYITGSREPGTLERINTDHPAAILFKPFTEEQLRATIARVTGG